jgi:hypothetical protein
MADGLIWWPGSEPQDQATAASPARAWKKPRAIWDLPVLWVQEQHGGFAVVVQAFDLG